MPCAVGHTLPTCNEHVTLFNSTSSLISLTPFWLLRSFVIIWRNTGNAEQPQHRYLARLLFASDAWRFRL